MHEQARAVQNAPSAVYTIPPSCNGMLNGLGCILDLYIYLGTRLVQDIQDRLPTVEDSIV